MDPVEELKINISCDHNYASVHPAEVDSSHAPECHDEMAVSILDDNFPCGEQALSFLDEISLINDLYGAHETPSSVSTSFSLDSLNSQYVEENADLFSLGGYHGECFSMSVGGNNSNDELDKSSNETPEVISKPTSVWQQECFGSNLKSTFLNPLDDECHDRGSFSGEENKENAFVCEKLEKQSAVKKPLDSMNIQTLPLLPKIDVEENVFRSIFRSKVKKQKNPLRNIFSSDSKPLKRKIFSSEQAMCQERACETETTKIIGSMSSSSVVHLPEIDVERKDFKKRCKSRIGANNGSSVAQESNSQGRLMKQKRKSVVRPQQKASKLHGNVYSHRGCSKDFSRNHIVPFELERNERETIQLAGSSDINFLETKPDDFWSPDF